MVNLHSVGIAPTTAARVSAKAIEALANRERLMAAVYDVSLLS